MPFCYKPVLYIAISAGILRHANRATSDRVSETYLFELNLHYHGLIARKTATLSLPAQNSPLPFLKRVSMAKLPPHFLLVPIAALSFPFEACRIRASGACAIPLLR